MSALAAILLMAGISSVGGSPAQDDLAKMAHAKQWSGTVTLFCAQSAKDGTTTLSIRRAFSFNVSLGRRQSAGGPESSVAFWSDDGSSTVEGGIADKRETASEEGSLVEVETETGRVGGPLKWGPVQLILNTQTKEYRLIVNPVYFDEQRIHKFLEGQQWTTDHDETRPGGASPLVRFDKPLPPAGTLLTGTSVVTQEYGSTLNSGMIEKLSFSVNYSLSPGGPPPEFVIDKSSFKDYVPDDDSGKVVIRSVKPDASPALIRVTLSGISREPGNCLNSADTGAGDDIEILASENSAFDAPSVQGGKIVVQTKQEVRTATLAIRCRDYGGWSTLKAEAKIGGEWKPVKLSDSGASTTQFPLDEDGDHVADAWENKYKVSEKPGDCDDDDTPSGDGARKGDGLTLYEEYRGFVIAGKHTDTDPRVKDLFLSDQTGGMAADGAMLFESVSKVKVHTKMSAEELSESRVVNRNHKDGPHAIDQHGIPVVKGPAKSDAEAVAVDDKKPFGPPVMTAKINLPAGRNYLRGAGAPDPSVEDGIVTIAHEIGHAVGIAHHDDGVAFVVWTAMEGPDGKKHIYEVGYDPEANKVYGPLTLIRVFRESTGVEVLDSVSGLGPYDETLGGVKRLLALSGSDDKGNAVRSQFSGVQDCIMRYPDADAYVPISKPNGNERWLPDLPATYKFDRLCDSKAGTGINAKDRKPRPRYGDATAGGNCKSQIVVSDLYSK